MRLSEAFQLVDDGPKKKTSKNDAKRSGNSDGPSLGRTEDKDIKLLLCLWEPHKKAGIRHLMRHCKECPPEEKKRLREEIAARESPNRACKVDSF